MYPSLNQAAADDYRHALQTEAAHQRLLTIAACCTRGWSRVAAWFRDVVRTTQLGPGYVLPNSPRADLSYFEPCCSCGKRPVRPQRPVAQSSSRRQNRRPAEPD